MFHPKVIFRVIGMLLFIEALFMLLCVGVALFYNESTVDSLLSSAGIVALVGAVLIFLCKRGDRNVSFKDGYIVVSLCWVVFSLLGTLPYMLSGSITNFTDAFFETMSGFSTTGATILQDIDSLPKFCCNMRCQQMFGSVRSIDENSFIRIDDIMDERLYFFSLYP